MNEDSKKTLLIIAIALVVVAAIYYYFHEEIEEQKKNDINGDSYEGQTEEDSIKADSSLNDSQKGKALDEAKEKASLRLEYSKLYTPAGGTTVEAPINYSLTQLRTAVQLKKQDVLQAAQNLYQQRTDEACPASLTPANWKTLSATAVLEIVNDIEDAANVIMAKYQDLYFRTTGTKCAAGLSAAEIKSSIKAYLNGWKEQVSKYNAEVVEAEKAWNSILNNLRAWGNFFAEASYAIKGKASYSSDYQSSCDEFINAGNDRDRAYMWNFARQAYLTRGYNNMGTRQATIDDMNNYNANQLLKRPNQQRAIQIRSYVQTMLQDINLWDECGYLKTNQNSPKNKYQKALAEYNRASSVK